MKDRAPEPERAAPAAPWAPELWGGLAAALVALPSAVAFGVAVLSPLGPEAAARGASAGLAGAAALGLLAPLTRGSAVLISAPSAPAAAVMGALAAELAAGDPAAAVRRLTLVALAAAAFQLAFAFLRGGRLMKYIPYPVVSGYLTGVGVLIVLKQLPSLLGLPHGASLGGALLAPASWTPEAFVVGLAAVAGVLGAPRLTRRVPPAVLGLAAGVLAHLLLGLRRPEILSATGNPLVVGAFAAAPLWSALTERAGGLLGASAADWSAAAAPAATLAVLLSVDALKTCVVVDALTETRHDADRVLAGQGLGNAAAALLGGTPGSGQMGATLINVTSGGATRRSALACGAVCAAALFAGPWLLPRLPLAALSGLLVVVGARMADFDSLSLLRRASTRFDFAVIAAVVVVALGVGLVQAAGAGVALSILLFLREQTRFAVVRSRATLAQRRSKQVRPPEESAVLDAEGARVLVAELQGPLFFGTADGLLRELEADLAGARHAVLDLSRVRSMDFTAAHLLQRLSRTLAARGGRLVLCRVPPASPTGQDLARYLRHLGLSEESGRVLVMGSLDEGLEWAEESLLEGRRVVRPGGPPLALAAFPLVQRRAPDTVAALAACARELTVKAGEAVFHAGDEGDELFLVRRGRVRIVLPLSGQAGHHLASFGPGEFFGEMCFLDRGRRTADAVAREDSELYAVSRARFEAAADAHPKLARQVFFDMAHALALRLRQADAELGALKEG
ncbi:MAG: SLC26A/SulP transporter family protein [Elusimicrobia bacterium]|nr:SLC26A/SulP transporter family protein [Elusimicrobiota bacterium]